MGSVSGNLSSFLVFLTYPLGDRSIESQAQTNFAKCISETKIPDTQHIPPLSPHASDISPRASRTFPRAPHIFSRASHIFLRAPRPLPPLPSRSSEQQKIGIDLEGLIQSGNLILKVIGLRKDSNDNSLSSLDLRLRADVTLVEIMAAIKDAGASSTILPVFILHAGTPGFEPPTWLYEEPEIRISVTEGDSVYDATSPGGLKVNK